MVGDLFSINENFIMELGDVLSSLLFIANLTGVTLEDVFAETVAKMEYRTENIF